MIKSIIYRGTYMKDYYELLEVSKNASDDTIKKVFRMLIKKNHPDLFEGEEKTKAEEKVKELNEAYETLSDKGKREKYNEELEQNNVNTDVAIETLIKENEYLKSVIQEKNRLIKKYLEEIGVDTRNIINQNSYNYVNEQYEENQNFDNNIQIEKYMLYQAKDILRKTIYMLLMIIGGIIILRISTGVNILEILTDIFKNMF